MTDIINEFIEKFNPCCNIHMSWFRMIYLERDKYSLNNNPFNINVEFMDIITKDLIIFGIADKYIRSILLNQEHNQRTQQILQTHQTTQQIFQTQQAIQSVQEIQTAQTFNQQFSRKRCKY